MKTYNIIYKKNGETDQIGCSMVSLEWMLEEVKKNGAEIVNVEERKKKKLQLIDVPQERTICSNLYK